MKCKLSGDTGFTGLEQFGGSVLLALEGTQQVTSLQFRAMAIRCLSQTLHARADIGDAVTRTVLMASSCRLVKQIHMPAVGIAFVFQCSRSALIQPLSAMWHNVMLPVSLQRIILQIIAFRS